MTEREAFEAWVSAPPFEKSVGRFPKDETQFAWPGSYHDIAVDLAWEAWQASRRAALTEAAEACNGERVDAEATGEETDRAYNRGCRDCSEAILVLRDGEGKKG